MAKFDVLDMNGKKVSTIELSDAVFGMTPNEKVMHAAVVNFLANQRQGTQSTKTRSEVSGGGKKPWRQKGTGRARQGSIRSPQWTTTVVGQINTYAVLNGGKLVISADAAKKLEEVFA